MYYFFTTAKQTIITLSLFASVVASAIEFESSDFWFMVDVGLASNLIQEDYQQLADEDGLQVSISDPQTSRLTWNTGLGWDFWRSSNNNMMLGTQIEWVDLGMVDLDYSTSIAESELDELYDGLAEIHPNSGHGLALGLTASLKSGEFWGMEPFHYGSDFGVLSWWQEYQLNGINQDSVRTDTASGLGWYAGLHLEHQIDERWSARIGTRLYQLADEMVQSTRVGLMYRFGVVDTPQPIVAQAEPAMDDRYVIPRGTIQSLNVLLNDEALGLDRSIARVTQPRNGTLSVSEDSTRIRYRHNGGPSESDSFNYWAKVGEQQFGPFFVVIEIVPLPPRANPDFLQVGFNTVSRLNVVENDLDASGLPLIITEFTQPDFGRVSILDNVLIYQHDGSSAQRTEFSYWVSNGESEAGPVSVELTILPEIFTIPVKFTPSSTVIRTEDKPALNRLSVWMFDNPEARVSISGHTDNTGGVQANQSLSVGRANAVLDYLATQGIDPSRLRAEGFGDSQPVASNETSEGRLQNRRVEFRLF